MNSGDLRASWRTATAEETFALGECLGRCFMGGLTIGLVGPLGTGKTQFVKGLASGNGLDDPSRVTSPTFTLIHEYPGRLRLCHVDVYRLEGVGETFIDQESGKKDRRQRNRVDSCSMLRCHFCSPIDYNEWSKKSVFGELRR